MNTNSSLLQRLRARARQRMLPSLAALLMASGTLLLFTGCPVAVGVNEGNYSGYGYQPSYYGGYGYGGGYYSGGYLLGGHRYGHHYGGHHFIGHGGYGHHGFGHGGYGHHGYGY